MRKFLAWFLAAVLTLNTAVLAACAERKRNDEDGLWRKEMVLSVEGIIKDCCMGSNDSLVSPLIWRRKGLGEAEDRPRGLRT